MRSILFIVPRNRFLVPSNWSFIFSARAVESLISPPMAFVNCRQTKIVSNPSPHNPKANLSIPAQRTKQKLTSFNIRTLPLIAPICSSFWLSNSSSTAFEY